MNFFNLNKIIELNNNVSSKRWSMVASLLIAFILTLIALFAKLPVEKYELVKDLIECWIMLSGASGGFVLAERGKWFNKITSSNDTNNNKDT